MRLTFSLTLAVLIGSNKNLRRNVILIDSLNLCNVNLVIRQEGFGILAFGLGDYLDFKVLDIVIDLISTGLNIIGF